LQHASSQHPAAEKATILVSTTTAGRLRLKRLASSLDIRKSLLALNEDWHLGDPFEVASVLHVIFHPYVHLRAAPTFVGLSR
jgi:hypothetical protein